MPREGKQGRGKKSRTAALSKTTGVRAPRRAVAPRKTSARVAATTPHTVALVGAGRLGTALALALAGTGYRFDALVAQHKAHARRAARLFASTRPRAFAATELSALPLTDLLLIATPDGEIAATAARLARSTHELNELNDQRVSLKRSAPRIALHTSGALSSDVLAPLRAAGFAVGSLHPLVSVSDARAGALSLRGAHYCIEGDARAVAFARKIVRALGGRSFSIKPADKALYHAAAVIASGHTVALFDLAAELLARCGVAPAAARKALLPLTASTLTNLLTADQPAHALTGPFARGDTTTIQRNLAALAATNDADALHIYALLGARLLRLAAQKGITAHAHTEIATMLADALRRAR
jgi:predicted short-subunit dehydrogenase-like oxidoreductase (DUF2520 family)